MREIAFIGPQRKVIRFRVEGDKVVYFDEFWKEGIQIYPYPKSLVRKLLKGKKPQLQAMGLLIHEANTGNNLKEYEACSNEVEIIEIIRKDALSKGLLEIK